MKKFKITPNVYGSYDLYRAGPWCRWVLVMRGTKDELTKKLQHLAKSPVYYSETGRKL